MRRSDVPNLAAGRPPSADPPWLRWAPFLILAGGAIVLAVSWDRLPERWITHWGRHGQPDGWTGRSVAGVFTPLAFGGMMCALLEALASGMSFFTGRADARLSLRAAATLGRMTAGFLRTLNTALALLFSSLAIALPLLQPQTPGLVARIALLLVGSGIALGMVRMARAYKAAVAQGEIPHLEGYNGIFYSNPKDERLWVPKMVGIGSTINFAHRWAWLVFLLLLAGPIAAVIIILLAT